MCGVPCALALALAACKQGAGEAPAGRETIAAAQASASVAISEAAQALAVASAPRPRSEADERMAIAAMPEQYIKAADVEADEKQALEHTLRLASLTLSNTSHFTVSALAGNVTWIDAKGVDLGTASFSIDGPIAADETKTFSAANGSLVSRGQVNGVAARSTITFNHVAFPKAP